MCCSNPSGAWSEGSAAVLSGVETGSSGVEKRLTAGRLFSRNAIVRVFSPELSDLPATDRYLAVEALLLAGDWDTWDRLRRSGEMDVTGAKSIVNRLVWAALASGTPPHA